MFNAPKLRHWHSTFSSSAAARQRWPCLRPCPLPSGARSHGLALCARSENRVVSEGRGQGASGCNTCFQNKQPLLRSALACVPHRSATPCGSLPAVKIIAMCTINAKLAFFLPGAAFRFSQTSLPCVFRRLTICRQFYLRRINSGEIASTGSN